MITRGDISSIILLCEKEMKVIKITVLLFLIYYQATQAEVIPSFTVTGECVENAEIIKSEISTDWFVIIKLNNSMRKEILEFSRNNISNEVRFALDLNDDDLIENNIVIREVFSKRIQLSGLQSKKEAIEKKNSILSSTGKCGYK